MKKKEVLVFLGIIVLTIFVSIGITFLNKKFENKNIKEDNPTKEYDIELIKCLEGQLGAYLVTETDDLIEIPLSEIKNSDKEKIAYYKGVYASNHPENKYVIVDRKSVV